MNNRLAISEGLSAEFILRPKRACRLVRPVLMGNGVGAALRLVRYTPIFCRPYTRGADRQPCATSRLVQRSELVVFNHFVGAGE
jgi:hypothetical protein